MLLTESSQPVRICFLSGRQRTEDNLLCPRRPLAPMAARVYVINRVDKERKREREALCFGGYTHTHNGRLYDVNTHTTAPVEVDLSLVPSTRCREEKEEEGGKPDAEGSIITRREANLPSTPTPGVHPKTQRFASFTVLSLS